VNGFLAAMGRSAAELTGKGGQPQYLLVLGNGFVVTALLWDGR
jgi:hypothetical protein